MMEVENGIQSNLLLAINEAEFNERNFCLEVNSY